MSEHDLDGDDQQESNGEDTAQEESGGWEETNDEPAQGEGEQDAV
jgi:hypothetical protein